MGRQRDDAGTGIIRIAEEVAVWIDSISGGVKAVRRFDGIENLLLIVVNYKLNRRAGNNVECRSGWHASFSHYARLTILFAAGRVAQTFFLPHSNPDRIVAVNEEKTVEACLSFVRDYHLLVGGSTGTVLAAVRQLAPEFRRGDTIVAISADLGEKYLDTIYDPAWVEEVIAPEDSRPARTFALVAGDCGAGKTFERHDQRQTVS